VVEAGAVGVNLEDRTGRPLPAAARATTELLTTGTYESTADAITYDTMNTLILGVDGGRLRQS
jgi:hypothetical protein